MACLEPVNQIQLIMIKQVHWVQKVVQLHTGLGSWSRSEPGVFESLEPQPLKKTGAGAAWKKSQEPEPLKN